MSSPERTPRLPLGPEYREQLLVIAREFIRTAIELGNPPDPAEDVRFEALPPELDQIAATFVTLHIGRDLRGCMGSLTARDPLLVDVAHNSLAAAFRDPRFGPVTLAEVDKLHIHISVLSESEPIEFASEAELLRAIRPGIDGLVLTFGKRRSTLLPAVWQMVEGPAEFLKHLKKKAGLEPKFWSDEIRVERYTTEDFEEE